MTDPEWPFEPGTAPFRVKGIAYKFHMDYVQSKLSGGVTAQAAALGDRGLVSFFEQTFLRV